MTANVRQLVIESLSLGVSRVVADHNKMKSCFGRGAPVLIGCSNGFSAIINFEDILARRRFSGSQGGSKSQL